MRRYAFGENSNISSIEEKLSKVACSSHTRMLELGWAWANRSIVRCAAGNTHAPESHKKEDGNSVIAKFLVGFPCSFWLSKIKIDVNESIHCSLNRSRISECFRPIFYLHFENALAFGDATRSSTDQNWE